MTKKKSESAKVYFSDFFDVAEEVLEQYGAFNISLIADFPLFIDPFLLFNSKKSEYQQEHKKIIDYVLFLKEKSEDYLSTGTINNLFRFPEVKQNWFGYSQTGNSGSGLGRKFATSLHDNLQTVFSSFGTETITAGKHLEKLCLFDSGIGRDNISDFITNLIKSYLLEYTQKFALNHLKKEQCKNIPIQKVRFNYKTETWTTESFTLPYIFNDFVLLTPKDILTKDETWINRADMLPKIDSVIESIPNEEIRAQINNYFNTLIPVENPKKADMQNALTRVIKLWPDLLDYYIKFKEERGAEATSLSMDRVKNTELLLVDNLRPFIDYLAQKGFYDNPIDSYEEAMSRVFFLKHVVENQDGYKIFYHKGQPIQTEAMLHIMFKLTWYNTLFDINAEVNNGRGPVDFKVSKGSFDSSLIEFKLAKNTQLENNLAKQVEIYQKANRTPNAIKVIFFFDELQYRRVTEILKKLNMESDKNIILVDARCDNKPSASKAVI